MGILKEPLKKYRQSVWLCVLSYPVYLVILEILKILQYLVFLLFRWTFSMNSGNLFVWIMGTFFFSAFVCALDTFAKGRKE